MTSPRWPLLFLAIAACHEPDVGPLAHADSSSAGLDGSEGAASSDASSDDGSGGPADGSDGGESSSSGGPPEGPVLLARARFEIPADTVVQNFAFDGETLVVADGLHGLLAIDVVDLTHPDRDQDALCPSNHPLDGCATVDYGAFGQTHDNRALALRPDGSEVAFHLYKDRSLQADAEPLPPDE